MKNRKGFVSNSSSSSFIMFVDKDFEMFPENEYLNDIFKIPKLIKRKDLYEIDDNESKTDYLKDQKNCIKYSYEYDLKELNEKNSIDHSKIGEKGFGYVIVKDWISLLKNKESWLYQEFVDKYYKVLDSHLDKFVFVGPYKSYVPHSLVNLDNNEINDKKKELIDFLIKDKINEIVQLKNNDFYKESIILFLIADSEYSNYITYPYVINIMNNHKKLFTTNENFLSYI